MYKYLIEKIEESNEVLFNQITVLALEANKEKPSEIIEEFTCLETKEICEVLDFKDTPEIQTMIEHEIKDESFISFLNRNRRTGFLAELNIPIPRGFMLDENQKVSSYECSQGSCRVAWVYADTLGELTEKAIEKANGVYNSELKKHMDKLESDKKEECYKTGEECIHNCKAQCKESC